MNILWHVIVVLIVAVVTLFFSTAIKVWLRAKRAAAAKFTKAELQKLEDKM